MKKPIFSKYFTSFMNNLSLYNGFYWVKIRNLGEFFKQFNGRDFAKRLQDIESYYEKIKPPKEIADNFEQMLEESNEINQEFLKRMNEISQSDISADEFKDFSRLFIRAKKVSEKIGYIKQALHEADYFKSEINKFKEIYYDLMDDHLKDIVDHHFKNLNFENLLEFENVNFLNYIFTEFENYLFKSFKFVLMKRPEIINKKSIKLSELKMIHENLNIELINEIIVENTLHDLFYKNYEEVFKKANDPIGLDIKIEEKDISILNGFKQIRNLYIHGDGNINLLFMKKIQRYKITFEDLTLPDLSIGEEIKVDMKLIKKLEKLTFKIVGIIDDSLKSKYPDLLENI